MIKTDKLLIFLFLSVLSTGCAPWGKLTSHDFSDDYYKLKSPGQAPRIIYATREADSIKLYSVPDYKSRIIDTTDYYGTTLQSIDPQSPLYKSSFTRRTLDIDLVTSLLKFRPPAGDVAPQLNASLNGNLYLGYKTDYFKFNSSYSELNKLSTAIRHVGFDFGFFTGIGITPVNPTVTMDRTIQEYDGIVFQKGIAFFATYANLSVGISLGFDNLLDKNKTIWIYNNKPWVGLMIGIANFY